MKELKNSPIEENIPLFPGDFKSNPFLLRLSRLIGKSSARAKLYAEILPSDYPGQTAAWAMYGVCVSSAVDQRPWVLIPQLGLF